MINYRLVGVKIQRKFKTQSNAFVGFKKIKIEKSFNFPKVFTINFPNIFNIRFLIVRNSGQLYV